MKMMSELALHISLIAVPLSHRFVELELDPETEVGELPELLRAALGQFDKNSSKANLLMEMLKKGNRFKDLKSGSLPALSSVISPLQQRAPPEAAGTEGCVQNATPDQIARHLQFAPPEDQPAPGKEGEVAASTEQVSNKRSRAPAAIFEPEYAKKSKSGKAKGRGNALESEKEKKPRKVYTRTGLHSRDPVKKAIALEKLVLCDSPEKVRKPGSSRIAAGAMFHVNFPDLNLNLRMA